MFNMDGKLTRRELAWQLVEVFDELRSEEINQVLARNVPMETLEFFASYGDAFGESARMQTDTRRSVPNLMLLGYLLRVLEERLLADAEPFDA